MTKVNNAIATPAFFDAKKISADLFNELITILS